MNRNILLLAATFLFLAASCGDNVQYIYKPKIHKLKSDQLYDSDLVYDVVFDAHEQNMDSLKKQAREMFLKGVDQFKNKRNAFAAVTKFKASLLIFPDAKTYYELGNALIETKRYEEAGDAYMIAKRLGFQPEVIIDMKEAMIDYMESVRVSEESYRLSSAVSTLYNCYKNGLSESSVLNERRLAPITQTPHYKNMMIGLQAEKVMGDQNSLFSLFKTAFRQNVSNLDIAVEDVELAKYNQSISYEFAAFIPEMENKSFGRDVGNDFFYVGIVKETEDYVAVLYNSVSYYGDEMQPTRTMLAVYDQQGGLKAQKMVACQCSAEKVKRCSIKDNRVVVEDYLRVWEKPVKDVSFDENKVKEHKLLAKATFSISAEGLITNEDVPAGYSDSSILAKAE